MRSIILVLALIPAIARGDGLTLEADVGVGRQLGIDAPALGVGVGGWIAPHLALTARAAAITLAPQQTPPTPYGSTAVEDYRRTFVFTGPSLQYWFDDHVWVSGGVGLATFSVVGNDNHGLGADLRAGYAFGAFDVSLKVMPSYFSAGGGFDPTTSMSRSWTTTGVALLAGYQLR